jgi:1A family penicillin-binding protein
MYEEPEYTFETFKKNLINLSKKLMPKFKQGTTKFNKWLFTKRFWKNAFLTVFIGFLVITGAFMLWVSSLRIPDLSSFQDKVLAGSTRIYDKTGEILLYDLNQDVKRQVVPFSDISQYAKNATIAIEDEDFYTHKGIALTSILRAVLVDIEHMSLSQGGSTITQQVIKNSLLTNDKKISRKVKEWVLALKLERVMSKDDILNLYLNSTPYGGTYYGIEVASQNFFGKSSKDLSIAEAAYLAALPQSPSYYSPYGNHFDALTTRKNVVLEKMKELGYITPAQYESARAEKVVFLKQQNNSIKAPHFVMFIKDYLIDKFGEDEVANGSLKVVTTLDFELQQKAEEIVNEYALKNEKNFNAENAALVAVEPTTGQILSMVGSRDYFDKKIQGSFNVATAHRQPGSAFKPFAYVTAFNKGYTPDTVLFDLPTQFSTACDAQGTPLPGRKAEDCYMPQNYDLQFKGPMTLRNALAQSRNIPSIKTLYLAGIGDTIKTAKDMGITSLTRGVNDYGLTLVLGGGEVSPLEITSAYSVFANNGLRNPYTGILKVTDKMGNVLEEYHQDATQVIPEQSALLINSILSDNDARLPLNGPGSATDFPGQEVALKTGTTNDYRDVWTVGYTPNIAVGAWAGNNDNSPMTHKTSGLIISPLWRAFMDEALKKYPPVAFKRPEPYDQNLKPILRGVWQGGQVYVVDKTTGNLANEFTPPENREERAVPNIHSILYWIDKNNPTGPAPSNPTADSQFNLWETPILAWANARSGEFQQQAPTQVSNTNNPDSVPHISITSPVNNMSFGRTEKIVVSVANQSRFPLTKYEFYLNGKLIGSALPQNPNFAFIPQEVPQTQVGQNNLRVVGYDNVQNKGEATVIITIRP